MRRLEPVKGFSCPPARLWSLATRKIESLNLCDKELGRARLAQSGISSCNGSSALEPQRMRVFAQHDEARGTRLGIAAQQRAELVAIDERQSRPGDDDGRPATERLRERLSAILGFIDLVSDSLERRAIARAHVGVRVGEKDEPGIHATRGRLPFAEITCV